MQPHPKIVFFAKKLVELSFEGDFVSEERVTAIIEVLRKNPLRNRRQTLKLYLIKLRAAMSFCEARLEYFGDIPRDTLKYLQNELEQHYSRKLILKTQENTDLLAGFRIFVGDDIWDASVAGQIEKLLKSF